MTSRASRSLYAVTRSTLLLATAAVTMVACSLEERPVTGTPSSTASAGASGAEPELEPDEPPVEGGEPAAVEGPSPVDLGAPGTVDLCVFDAGACSSTAPGDAGPSCPGCLIDGECVGAEVVDEANPCGICAPERDALGWSPNDGVACDDGLFCTVDDVCVAGVCGGAARECDDGVACNGVSSCDEESDDCSPGESQCGDNFVCDVASDTCVTTCAGCLIDGVCLQAGSEAAGNPCQICNPMVSTTAFTPALGKLCGAAANACSQQDTCNAQGFCQANDLPAGTPCGSSVSSDCDRADSCDGAGRCLQRLAQNGTACNDGAYCTDPDQCQGGRCVAVGSRSCAPTEMCDEGADQCVSRQALGTTCTQASQCLSGFCRTWFLDVDGDAFGSGAPLQMCSPSLGDDRTETKAHSGFTMSILEANGRRYSSRGDDCCDVAAPRSEEVYPGSGIVVTVPQTACANVAPFDRDCSGAEEDAFDDSPNPPVAPGTDPTCSSVCRGGWVGVRPVCGGTGTAQRCQRTGGVCALTPQQSELRICW